MYGLRSTEVEQTNASGRGGRPVWAYTLSAFAEAFYAGRTSVLPKHDATLERGKSQGSFIQNRYKILADRNQHLKVYAKLSACVLMAQKMLPHRLCAGAEIESLANTERGSSQG